MAACRRNMSGRTSPCGCRLWRRLSSPSTRSSCAARRMPVSPARRPALPALCAVRQPAQQPAQRRLQRQRLSRRSRIGGCVCFRRRWTNGVHWRRRPIKRTKRAWANCAVHPSACSTSKLCRQHWRRGACRLLHSCCCSLSRAPCDSFMQDAGLCGTLRSTKLHHAMFHTDARLIKARKTLPYTWRDDWRVPRRSSLASLGASLVPRAGA